MFVKVMTRLKDCSVVILFCCCVGHNTQYYLSFSLKYFEKAIIINAAELLYS